MTPWLYQMSANYWETGRDPVLQYREEIARGSEICWPRFMKVRARRTDRPLPAMRRGDSLLLVFLPSTVHPSGRPIEMPGIYGMGILTADEDTTLGRDAEIRWRPLPETASLAKYPIHWHACRSFFREIRGASSRGTVYRIPAPVWERLKAIIDGWVNCKRPPRTDPSKARRESRMHTLLKSYVMARAEDIFGAGWKPYAAEYRFPETGDCADLILKGPGNQRLVVAIQTRARDLTGLHRAVKYQAILPVEEPVSRVQVRAALVAAHFTQEVANACQAHGVLAVRLVP
ncbi:MAG: hypothetical protein ACE5JQ_12065 [Candidatus Methylomirabilales bacterium]